MSIMIIRYLSNDATESSPGEPKENICIRVVVIIQVLDRFCDSLDSLVKGKAIFNVFSEDVEGSAIWGQFPNGRFETGLNKLECHSERRRRQGVVIKKRLIAREQRMPIQQGRTTNIPTQRYIRIEKPNELVEEAKTTDRICA